MNENTEELAGLRQRYWVVEDKFEQPPKLKVLAGRVSPASEKILVRDGPYFTYGEAEVRLKELEKK